MKRWSDTTVLWILFAVALLPVFYFSSLRPWTWGLMDEPGFVLEARAVRSAPTLQEKLTVLFPGILPRKHEGRFRPLFEPYLTGRLVMVESAAFQHAVQFVLVLMVLFCWFRLAAWFRVEPWVIPLGLLLTLYFSPFTVASINFLSIQELPGLLWVSCGLFWVTLAVAQDRPWLLASALGAFLIACLLKETFFILIPTYWVCLLHRGMRPWERAAFAGSLALFLVIPVFLMLWVKGNYSAGYTLQLSALLANAGAGLRNLIWTYKLAVPFLAMGLILKVKRHSFDRFDLLCLVGLFSYFGVIIPWTSEMTYYHSPLGPFLGFLTARGAFACLEAIPPSYRESFKGFVVATAVLCSFNVARQLYKSQLYNDSVRQVEAYLVEHVKGETVYVNGNEAAVTLPMGMNLLSGRRYDHFVYDRPETSVKSPAWILIYTEQTRYPSPALPAGTEKVLSTYRWDVYRLAGHS